MSKFLTDLRVKSLNDREWLLLDDLVYASDVMGGLITVPTGFITDLASVPRLPLAYLLAGGKANRPAVVHDFLYVELIGTRAQADAVFLEAMEVDGQSWWRRRLMYTAVRLGGWAPYNRRVREKEES